jgi:hypothetical protein
MIRKSLTPLQKDLGVSTTHGIRFSHNHDTTFPPLYVLTSLGDQMMWTHGEVWICDLLWSFTTHSLSLVTLFGHKTNESREEPSCWFARGSVRRLGIDSITRDFCVGPDLILRTSIP